MDDLMSEQQQLTLVDIFGQSSAHPLLVGLSAFRLLVAIAAIFFNSILIYVTIRNKNLHGSCNLFIAAEAFFGILTMTSFAYSFILAISGQNFIKLGECMPIMAYGLFSNYMWKCSLFLISLDRLLIVSFPLVFGRKPMIFIGISLSIASAYSGFILYLTWAAIDQPGRYERNVTCLVADLTSDVGPVGNFALGNSLSIAVIAILTYLLIWAVLKWKSDKSEQEKSSRQYTRQIYKMLLATAMLTIFGWVLNPLIRLIQPSFNLNTIQKLWLSVILSCFTSSAMLANPFIIYIFSKDYKEAFRKLLFHIGLSNSPPHMSHQMFMMTTKVMPMQTTKTRTRSLMVTTTIMNPS